MTTIAVDEKCIDKIKKIDGVQYVYVFNKEPLKDLLNLNLKCVNYKYIDYVDINLTSFNIDCLKTANINESDYYKMPEKVDFKIGIIIPNCNYADCLDKCLNSILNQTYQNFEIVFIDDCSTDNSVEIASKLLKLPHKVIQLKQKRYNGGARNEAYLHLSNDVDYIWYVDSDDWLFDNDVLKKINDKLQVRPDVLFVGMAKFQGNKLIKEAFIPKYKNKYDAMAGWSGSCGKVIKKSLAMRQECLYNEGTLKEDKNQHCRVCIYMKTFVLLKEPVYVWNRQNSKSVTTIRDEVMWGTSTIRHYADTKQLYLSVKGEDAYVDAILEDRLRLCKKELEDGGDKQY